MTDTIEYQCRKFYRNIATHMQDRFIAATDWEITPLVVGRDYAIDALQLLLDNIQVWELEVVAQWVEYFNDLSTQVGVSKQNEYANLEKCYINDFGDYHCKPSEPTGLKRRQNRVADWFPMISLLGCIGIGMVVWNLSNRYQSVYVLQIISIPLGMILAVIMDTVDTKSSLEWVKRKLLDR